MKKPNRIVTDLRVLKKRYKELEKEVIALESQRSLALYVRAIHTDLDSVKHQSRVLHHKFDTILEFFRIKIVIPDLEKTVNPTKEDIELILKEEREREERERSPGLGGAAFASGAPEKKK